MSRTPAVLLFIGLTSAPAVALAFAGDPSVQRARHSEVVLSTAPEDLTRPEGRTRWDLSAVARWAPFVRTISAAAGSVTLEEVVEGPAARGSSRTVYSDPLGGDAALRWLYPDQFRGDLRPGSRQTLEVEERKDGAVDRLRIDLEVVGIGWLHLPSGPREVVLQRALISREPEGSRGFVPEALVHRWVDPLFGVAAEISSPASEDGRARAGAGQASVLEAVIESAATLKIHVSELLSPNFTDIFYGRDRGANTLVSSLDPAGYGTIGALIAASTWDFSGNTTGAEIASTTTPVNAQETCNFAQCGYDPNAIPGGQLERSDKNFGDPNTLRKLNDVAQREDRPGDVTVWLRAGAQNEGVSGTFGSGESRFCYVTSGSVTRTPVPLWRMSHLDPNGTERYFQAGDAWEGGPFNCEQNIYNQVCGASQFADKIWTKACGTHTGKQFSDVLKGGVVTVPSGHTFNALLVRTVADFCVYTNILNPGCTSNCCRDGTFSNKMDEVRTVNYLWQVPQMGTVARLQSAQNVPDMTSFTTVAETDFKFGLFPPLSITVTGMTDTTVSLSWDPGLDTHRINAYRIYWDTDSGSNSPYAFDSLTNPSQVSFAGTAATVSGLTPGTTYYFTVTSRSTFTDPSTTVATTYESLLYPTQVSGDPSFVYPIEVLSTTTCPLTAEVTGVSVSHSAGDIEICWDPSPDPCVTGYRILGSNTADSDAGFTTVADVGVQTCWTGNPSQTYFLVVTRGAGGTGPWGHYGR